MSKICTNCGAQIADGSGFCPNCGTAAPPDNPAGESKFCPNCGSPVNAGASFCDKCGSPLNTAQPAQQPTPPVQQQTYVQPAPPPVQPVQQQTYVQPAPPPVQPVQQQTYVQPAPPPVQQYQQPVQQQTYVQPAPPPVQQYQQPVQQQYVQPAMQPAGGVAVKQKKSKYPLIITIIAVFLAIALIVVLIFNPFGKGKSPLGEKLEASFSNLCDMTKLGSQSYAYARLLTEQLLETDLASADPNNIGSLFDQCLDAWQATEEVSNNIISMSGELAADKTIQNAKVNNSKVSAVYASPDIVDILFPFTVHASAEGDDVTTEVSAVASPAESVAQCSTLGMQILSDSQSGYTAVMNLRSIYSGRTTPVQEWNNAVNTMATNFGMKFYVSGEITSGAFTTLPNGTHSIRTLSNTIKGGTVGVSNTDILIDIGDNGGCIVYGTTCGLTINQEQFPDYTPSDGNRTISINTYPEEPNENGVTFHATSFFSWFRIDRVGGFHITRGNKGEGSVTDPPVVQNTGGGTYTPPETNRGPIGDFVPPTSPGRIRNTSTGITNGNSGNNSGNSGNSGNPGGSSEPPLTGSEITNIAGDLGAGVGPITVTLGWQTEDDLDLHMITPDGSRIYYRNKTAQGGTLDVDMNAHDNDITIPAIENIFFPDPENGHYKVYLRDFYDRTQDRSTHWIVKVKVGDTEKIFEGDINTDGTEQFVFEFDYGGHGTGSTLPGDPDSGTLVDNVISRGGHTGKISISTMWNRFDDVDLHCEAPGDAHIYYGNKTAGGGLLDVDANAGGQRILDPVENVFFAEPKNGHYKIYLNEYADRSDDSASYLVRVEVDGEVREFRGTIDGTGTDIPIYEFDYNGASETPTGEFGGHRYEYYPNADIKWTEARSMAQSMGGHLVTITSAEEQAFIESTFPNTTGWIGAYGDNNGWSWVTGETFGGYTHWKSGEPNDQGGIEWCGHLWTDMTWNDLDNEDISGYQKGFYVEYDEYGDGTVYVRPEGNTGNTDNTSGGDGYWRLTKVTPYIYDGTRNTEGTSSSFSNEAFGETTELFSTEIGTGVQFNYHNSFSYRSYGKDRSGSSDAKAAFTFPKTAYAPEETAVISLTASASDSGDGSTGISISADFWRGPHVADNLNFTQSSRFTDDDGNYSCDADSPNFGRTTPRPSSSALTVKGKFPEKPYDLIDEESTIRNIRIGCAYIGYTVYTYEWTSGSMPSNVGAASGYVSGGSTGNNGNTDDVLTGTYNGHTYKVIEQEMYPLEADEYCRSLGGYLATITSQGEQDFVAGLAAQVSSESFYIGGSDYGSEGNWYWMNGEAWNYTAWYPGGSVGDPEPNNGLGAGEDYVVMNKSRDYMWVDCYGGYSMTREYFICEWGDYDTTGSNPGGIQDERIRQGAGNGEITITLMWDSKDDLDLHIFTPDESELWWGNPSAQGGTFDIDANREGNIKEHPIENAYFPNPVSGEYWVYVYNYEDRTPGKSTNWTVRVQVGDEEQIYSGTITNQEETIEVLGFSYTAGSSSSSGVASAGTSANLLINGNASNGMAGWNDPDGFWTTDINYDGVSALDSYYFCTKGLKQSGGSSRMYQDVNVSGYAGKYATLSADLRAYRSGHPDEMMMGIEFLNADGTVIESYETQKESGNAEWHLEGLTVTVPSGAVTARCSLYTFYKSGSESDAYYDNVSFTVS